jgi:hypothetical protein
MSKLFVIMGHETALGYQLPKTPQDSNSLLRSATTVVLLYYPAKYNTGTAGQMGEITS